MNRRNFLAASGAAASAAPSPRRNVVLVYCEQFQHNVASFAGRPAHTPNLEKLAPQSVVFRTTCTRAALFTGRLGHRTGLDGNCNVWHSRLTRLRPEIPPSSNGPNAPAISPATAANGTSAKMDPSPAEPAATPIPASIAPATPPAKST